MKGVIVYKGKYGATRQYACWAGKELGLPVLMPGNAADDNLAASEYVLIGSSVYIGRMLIKKWLKQHVKTLRAKKLFLFVVCGTPADEKEKLQGIINHNVPTELLNRVEIFFLPGRMIHKELTWFDRLMVNFGARLEADPVKKAAVLADVDGVKKENLAGLLDAVREYRASEKVSA